MLTNPNTLGIFESRSHKIAEILHRKGGLLYMDGANMNALVGKARPGDFGVDVMHLNLHKTFSTPHGGGGPGSGPVACKTHLEPFLPTPVVVENADGTLRLDYDRPHSIGRVRAFFGNFGMFVRALAYIMANGPDGLRQTTEDAVLNANYMRKKLEGIFDLPYATPTMHEVVFSDATQARKGIKTGDIAKRLIDYGFHPYTVSFPMIVPGALMIEPTESESLEELDLFVDAMKSIAQEAIEHARACCQRAALHPPLAPRRNRRRPQTHPPLETQSSRRSRIKSGCPTLVQRTGWVAKEFSAAIGRELAAAGKAALLAPRHRTKRERGFSPRGERRFPSLCYPNRDVPYSPIPSPAGRRRHRRYLHRLRLGGKGSAAHAEGFLYPARSLGSHRQSRYPYRSKRRSPSSARHHRRHQCTPRT